MALRSSSGSHGELLAAAPSRCDSLPGAKAAAAAGAAELSAPGAGGGAAERISAFVSASPLSSPRWRCVAPDDPHPPEPAAGAPPPQLEAAPPPLLLSRRGSVGTPADAVMLSAQLAAALATVVERDAEIAALQSQVCNYCI